MGSIFLSEREFGLEKALTWETADTKIPDSANDKQRLEEAERRKNRRRRGDLRPRPRPISDSVPHPNLHQLPAKEKIPLANFDIYPKKELPRIRISKKLPSPSCESPSTENKIEIQLKGNPKCLGHSGIKPRFQLQLSCYFLDHENVCTVKELRNFLWCEGPFIRLKTRYARWHHANFFAKLKYVDGTTSYQRYFAEVIEFNLEFRPSIRKVTACVPIDQNMNVVAENSLKCVICDCDQICHPSSEFCIADVSSLNPYKFKQWIEIGQDVCIPDFLSMNVKNCLQKWNQFGHPSSDNNNILESLNLKQMDSSRMNLKVDNTAELAIY